MKKKLMKLLKGIFVLLILIGCIKFCSMLSVSRFDKHQVACKNGSVNKNDTMEKVKAMCGDPSSVATSVLEWESYSHGYQSGGKLISPGGKTIEKHHSETWLYFDPNNSTKKIEFLDGKLVKIETY